MNFRTDLALERSEQLGKNRLNGVKIEKKAFSGVTVTEITVESAEGERRLGRPIGHYITVQVEPFFRRAQLIGSAGLTTLRDELRSLLPPEGSVLVAGLGNPSLTADAFGPRCAGMILPTRHITPELAKSTGLNGLRNVACISPGVLGETGVEAAEIIAGVTDKIKPAAVVIVDALAAAEKSRLGCTVQLSDTGIVPGSGVGNSRQKIDSTVLGVPVFSVGVPTVISASALGGSDSEEELFVTPREIDLVIERAAKLTSLALNCALQPSISAEDILMLTA